MISTNDTICAIATAPGIGGLAVIRVSGPQAFSIVDRLFRSATKISDAASHTIIYGKLRRASSDDDSPRTGSDVGGVAQHQQDALDTVTCSVFRSPHSYTGEDVVEIGCHGGEIVPSMIVSELVHVGARMSRAGEFTQRAFLNGKLDLTQVESVADLIHASSEASARVAGRQLFGAFKLRIQAIRKQLIDVCAFLELELDFAQEDVEFVSRDKVLALIDEAIEFCDTAASGFRSSVVLRGGYKVALVGRPNAGKSSLYNTLLGFDRSIVHSIAGTTRDYIQESVMWDGLRYQLCDTAGIRSSEDSVEVEGMERGSTMISESHMILVVNDHSVSPGGSVDILCEISTSHPDKMIVLVQNKCEGMLEMSDTSVSTGGAVFPVFYVSAKTGQNVAHLRSHICSVAVARADVQRDVLLNERQLHLLLKTRDILLGSQVSIKEGVYTEAVSYDIRQAVDTLGEITGEVINEDIINTVFAGFCIGK